MIQVLQVGMIWCIVEHCEDNMLLSDAILSHKMMFQLLFPFRLVLMKFLQQNSQKSSCRILIFILNALDTRPDMG